MNVNKENKHGSMLYRKEEAPIFCVTDQHQIQLQVKSYKSGILRCYILGEINGRSYRPIREGNFVYAPYLDFKVAEKNHVFKLAKILIQYPFSAWLPFVSKSLREKLNHEADARANRDLAELDKVFGDMNETITFQSGHTETTPLL